ncbi:MAG: response regulator [Propionibacteriales bacterium]|nr:response regulator [Propionibacteriales bacterium]
MLCYNFVTESHDVLRFCKSEGARWVFRPRNAVPPRRGLPGRPEGTSASDRTQNLTGGVFDWLTSGGVDQNPIRVLVVDDSATIRSLIAINLQLEGFDVVEARDGQECLDVVRAVQPALITLDVAMPRLDGFSTAARLRADPGTARIPIVMVTARAQDSDLAYGAELGVDAYVTKPFDPGHLVAVVRSLAVRGSWPASRYD